jgi:hypothetical protein
MRRAVLFACALTATSALAAVASSGAQETPPAASLHLVSKQISERGPHSRPHAGSTIVFSGSETGDDTGHSYVQCTLIDGRIALCIGQWKLAKGTLSAQTAIPLEPSPKKILLAVTGGTGAYDGARGTATLIDIGKDKTDEVFTFKP